MLSLVTSAPVLCLDTARIPTASLIVLPLTSPITSQSIPILSFEEPVSVLFEISIVIPLTSTVPEVLVSLIDKNEFENSSLSSDSSKTSFEDAVEPKNVTSYPSSSAPIVRVPFADMAGV